MDRGFRLDGVAQAEAISEMSLRINDVRAEIMLFGSKRARECADEYPAKFRDFADRATELGDEDAERPRDERAGVRANTFKAYFETLDPFVKRLAEAMRKDMA